ncbi:hypothetical protein DFH28DRAFT_936356 [Melampsora americana]|nr:hypothetical protein DFH28DRAFT_936356 [Melampsora americana]
MNLEMMKRTGKMWCIRDQEPKMGLFNKVHTKNVQINDSWYPFESLENVIPPMCYGKARNLLSRTQYEMVHSLDLAKLHLAHVLDFDPVVSNNGLVKEYCLCTSSTGHNDIQTAPLAIFLFMSQYIQTEWVDRGTVIAIPLLNPWRTRAQGKVAQNLPLTIFLSREGVSAYNSGIKKDVLVMAVQPVHLCDSSMHSEITNTYNPGTSLHRCRQWHLGADSKALRQSGVSYVWSDTKCVSENVWNDTQKPNTMTKVNALQKCYGSKDTMIQPFVDKYRKLSRQDGPSQARIFATQCERRLSAKMSNPFFQLDDTPVECLHVMVLGVVKYLYRDALQTIPKTQLATVVAKWKAFNTSGQSIQQLQPSRLAQGALSLTGKEFCILKHGQALSSIEPTHSPDSMQYDPIECKMGEQTKLHMLTQVPASIRRHRPPVLYNTESFESENALTQTASIHSSHHDPSQHLAESFKMGKFQGIFLVEAWFGLEPKESGTNEDPNWRLSSLIQSLFNWMSLIEGPFANQPQSHHLDHNSNKPVIAQAGAKWPSAGKKPPACIRPNTMAKLAAAMEKLAEFLKNQSTEAIDQEPLEAKSIANHNLARERMLEKAA